VLHVVLVTRGSPDQVTGGHLYHRRMAELAPRFDAEIEFAGASVLHNPLRSARDVIVVDSITAWSVAPFAVLRRAERPVAAMLHQPPGGVGLRRARAALQRPFDLACYRRCDLLIAASQVLGEQLVADHGLRAERVRVVEPGSDLPDAVRPAPGMRGDARIALLCVANWVPNKGVIELLDAVAALPRGDLTLHLAGRRDMDAGYTSRVQARSAAPELLGRVVVHGQVTREEVGSLLAGADAFALMSYAETYGTVHGEALAAGVPTVGWRSGNLPNLIEDGREGCLVTPGDVPGLTAVLHRLAHDEPWRERLRLAAVDRGRTLPTWTDAAEQFFGSLRALSPRRG
jgi:glycosyltransferase involved in cell wall biosynthesis